MSYLNASGGNVEGARVWSGPEAMSPMKGRVGIYACKQQVCCHFVAVVVVVPDLHKLIKIIGTRNANSWGSVQLSHRRSKGRHHRTSSNGKLRRRRWR